MQNQKQNLRSTGKLELAETSSQKFECGVGYKIQESLSETLSQFEAMPKTALVGLRETVALTLRLQSKVKLVSVHRRTDESVNTVMASHPRTQSVEDGVYESANYQTLTLDN